MGLDMYFEARKKTFTSFSSWEDKEGVEDKTNYPKDLTLLAGYIYDKNFKSVSVEEYYQIGYFRKFNALHNYIVKHFADGIDECQRIYLFKNNIEQMLNDLKEVKADHSKANDLLSTTNGCFFGSQEYEDWYFNDVDEAIEMFTLFLENLDFKTYDLIYQASW